MDNAIVKRLADAGQRARQEAAERPAAESEFNESLDVTWGAGGAGGKGTRTGLRYAQLNWVRLYSPTMLTITFATHSVTVKGERLGSVYERVLAMKQRSLRVTTNKEKRSLKPDEPIVTEVSVLQRSGNTVESEPDDDDVPVSRIRQSMPSRADNDDVSEGGGEPTLPGLGEFGGMGRPREPDRGDDVSDLSRL